MRSPMRARLGRALAAAGLTMALLLPGVAPATAQTANVLRVGTGQDLDSMNPYSTALVVGFEVFTLNYELLVGFGQQLEPVPGFAETWTVSDDGLEYTFTIPRGQALVGRHAGDLRGRPLLAPAPPRRDQRPRPATCASATSTRTWSTPRSRAVTAPDPQTLVVTLDRPNDRILKTYVPIIPAHIWADKAATICDDLFETPDRRLRPVPGPGVGDRPVRALHQEPELPDDRWPPTRSSCRSSRPRTRWPRRSATASSTTPRTCWPTSSTSSRACEGITTVAGTANGFTELGFNTYGTGTGNVIEGGGPSTHGPARSGLPRRARLRHRQGAPRRSRPGWLRRGRDDPGAAVPDGLAQGAGDRPHLRPGPGRPEADGRRLRPRCVGRPPRQGRQPDRPGPGLPGLRYDLRHVGRVHHRRGGATWASRSTRPSTTPTPWST